MCTRDRDINEHIEKVEKVVIIGPSGSGKSTFLRCLNLLETPTAGEIWIDNEQINAPKVNVNKLRQKMGMVFQHFNLFPHLTVKRNITLAPVKLGLMSQEQADKRALELLERIGLPDKADEYPNMLSGGQKQRIAIAVSYTHLDVYKRQTLIWCSVLPMASRLRVRLSTVLSIS